MSPTARTVLVATTLILACSSACGQAEEDAAPQIYSLAAEPTVAHAASTAQGKAGSQAKGKVLYDMYCVSCHGASGRGDGPAAAILSPRPRDHTNRAYMDTLTDEYLANIIRKGGAALGRSPTMPPAKTLTDDDIGDLIARIRSLAQ